MDALVYASITNNLTSDDELSDLHKTNVFMKPPVIWVNDKTGDLKVLDDLLSQTVIKKSACMGNPTVSVRIPIPNDVTPYPQNSKFGYIDKNVVVPDKLRQQMIDNGYSPNSDKCNKFMHLYCKNSLKEYLTTNGGTFNRNEWPNFKPECACYGQQPSWMADYGSLPAVCWAPQCSVGSGAYLDLASQGNPNCTLQICNQNIDLSKIQAQQIDSTIQATCNQNQAKGPDNPFVNPPTTTTNPSQPNPVTQTTQPSQPFQPPVQATVDPNKQSESSSNTNISLIFLIIVIILIVLGIIGYFVWNRKH